MKNIILIILQVIFDLFGTAKDQRSSFLVIFNIYARFCEEAFRDSGGSELLDEGRRGSFETLSNPKYSGKMQVREKFNI